MPVVAFEGKGVPLIRIVPRVLRPRIGVGWVMVKPVVPPRLLKTGTPLRYPVGARLFATLIKFPPVPPKVTSRPLIETNDPPDTLSSEDVGQQVPAPGALMLLATGVLAALTRLAWGGRRRR
jgi:hypothetical protein